MKNILAFFLLSIGFSINVVSQNLPIQNLNGCIIERVALEDYLQDSLIHVDAQFQKYFINIMISNRQNNNIIINWDESTIINNGESCTIMFAPPSIETNNTPKGTTTIRHSTHIEKLIFSSASLGKNGFLPIFSKSEIKKSGSKIIDFIFCINSGDKQLDYKVRYKISLEK